MSSLFVQTTVAPTGTVTVCGPKLKLSIFTPAGAGEGRSAAVTLVDPANSSSAAIITGAATPASHIFFLVIFFFPFQVLSFLRDLLRLTGSLAVYPRVESTTGRGRHSLKPKTPSPRAANRRLQDCD